MTMSDTHASVSRRRFCAGACQVASGATFATLFSACGGGSPTGPSGAWRPAGHARRAVHRFRRAGDRRRVRSGDEGGAVLVESNAGVFLLSRAGHDDVLRGRGRLHARGLHRQRRRRRHLRVPVPRVALQPRGPGGQRPRDSVPPAVLHLLRRRRRDHRALTCRNWTSRRSSAPPRRIRRQPRRRRDVPRHVARAAVAHLVDYEGRPDDVDERIGRPDHAQVSHARSVRARHRHRRRAPALDVPHGPYAAAAAGKDGAVLAQPLRHRLQQAGRRLGHDAGREDARAQAGVLRGPQGQIELFRQYALGNYRDLLVEVAQDPAMLVWLDGKDNTKARPQENFGREVMELFSSASATTPSRTSTPPPASSPAGTCEVRGLQQRRVRGRQRLPGVRLQRGPARHRRQDVLLPDLRQRQPDDPVAQRVGGDAGRHRPDHGAGRAPRNRPPAGAEVLELLHQRGAPARSGLRDQHRQRLPAERHGIRPVVRYVLTSPWFTDPAVRHARYSWPADSSRGPSRRSGWQNFSLDQARAPMANMGMQLFEPPNVGGWPLGEGWFSTSTMLARSNFAAALASNQKAFLAAALQPDGRRRRIAGAMLARVTPAPFDAAPQQALRPICSPAAPGRGARSRSAPGRPDWRACWSPRPNTSSCRRGTDHVCFSTTVHPQRCRHRHARASRRRRF